MERNVPVNVFKGIHGVRYEISSWQLSLIIVSFNLSILVSYAPVVTGMLPPVRDAWLSALLAVVPALALCFLSYWLVKRFQGENLYEFTRTILGSFFGTIMNVAVVAAFIHWAVIVTREFALFMDSVVYLRTPDIVFVIIFLILGVVGASQQIEFIGRIAEVAGLFVIVGVVFLIVANVSQMDIGMLRPFFVDGWKPVLTQALTPAAIFSEAAWIILIGAPYLSKISETPRAIGIGLSVNVVFNCIIAAVLIAIFGPELISILAFIPLSAARLIQIAAILERLEWMLLLLWFGAMGVKVSFLLWSARLGLSSLFPRWKGDTNLIIVAALAFGWSFVVFPKLTDILRFFDPKIIIPQISGPLMLPVLLSAIALLRGIKGEPPGKNVKKVGEQ